MNKLLVFTLFALVANGQAFAGGSSDNHGDKKKHGYKHMSVGMPGKAGEVSHTIHVIMKETDDGKMLFEPSSLSIKKGETIKFAIKNIGEIEHEFILDDHQGIMKHKMAMEEATTGHKHGSHNALTLGPGEKGSIIWAFTNSGEFEFACLIPGHYDAGMKGRLKVAIERAD